MATSLLILFTQPEKVANILSPMLPPLLLIPPRPAPLNQSEKPLPDSSPNSPPFVTLNAFASASASTFAPGPIPQEPIVFEDGQRLRHEPLTDVARRIQKETHQHQEGQRAVMEKKHNGKLNVITLAEGDFTMLAIPSEDRTSLDDPRLAVKIIGVPKDNIYTLQCKYGILKRSVGISSLDVMHADVARRLRPEIDNASSTVITLHKAA